MEVSDTALNFQMNSNGYSPIDQCNQVGHYLIKLYLYLSILNTFAVPRHRPESAQAGPGRQYRCLGNVAVTPHLHSLEYCVLGGLQTDRLNLCRLLGSHVSIMVNLL